MARAIKKGGGATEKRDAQDAAEMPFGHEQGKNLLSGEDKSDAGSQSGSQAEDDNSSVASSV